MGTLPQAISNILGGSLVRTVPSVVRRLFASARRASRLFGATTMSEVFLAGVMTRYPLTVTHAATPILGHNLHLVRQGDLSRNWTS